MGCISNRCKSAWLCECQSGCTDLNLRISRPWTLHKHRPKRHPLPAGFTGTLCYPGWARPYNSPLCVVLIVLSLEPAWPCLCYTAGVLSPDPSAPLAHAPRGEAGMSHPHGPPGHRWGRCLVVGLGNAPAPSMALLSPDGGASLPSPGFVGAAVGRQRALRAAVQRSMVRVFRLSVAISKYKRRH